MALDTTTSMPEAVGEPLKPSPSERLTTASQVPILEELPAAHVGDELVMDALWGDESAASTGLEYIKAHALRMRARVTREDPHSAYIPLRSKSPDVRLFKVATLVAATPLEHERCDFRGVTRVPGSLETVLGLLASDDARESYWVALNTQRGLLVDALIASRRLEASAPFPRWNQRYSVLQFSKHARPVECCVSEYAMLDEEDDEDEDAALAARRTRLASQDLVAADGAPLRRAFVYRRSIDHRLFDLEDVDAKLGKYGESQCERLYVQDLLYEISETTEKHICKVVLTCSVYITTTQPTGNNTNEDKAKSMRHEFREFCTHSLLSLRQVLSNQWAERMASAGVTAPGSLLARSLGRGRAAGQPAHCGVCSAAFSLLKKRHVCHACALVVCSRCCTKQEAGKSLLSSSGLGLARTASAHDLNSRRATRECILCAQFGPDGAGASRVSVSIRRHFASSTLNSARSLASDADETLSNSGVTEGDDEEDEDVRVVNSPEDLDTAENNQDASAAQDTKTASVPAKPRSLRVRASTEDNTITTGWREPGPEVVPRHSLLRTPTLAPSTPQRRRVAKQRCESVNIPPRAGGIVLLTDIDTLSLTGSFRLDGSRRGSGGSDAGSTASSSNFVRASPPLPPAGRWPVRSVSEDTTLAPASTEEQDIDDLANFNLKLL